MANPNTRIDWNGCNHAWEEDVDSQFCMDVNALETAILSPPGRYAKTSVPRAGVAARFWKNVNKDGPPPSGKPSLGKCWLWTGFSHKGYGVLNVLRRPIDAHRISWVLAGNRLPTSNRLLHHLCENTLCVNPHHLLNVAKTDHASLGKNARKTHCPRGHPYEGPSLAGRPSRKGRWCRECKRIHDRAQTDKRRKYASRQEYYNRNRKS